MRTFASTKHHKERVECIRCFWRFAKNVFCYELCYKSNSLERCYRQLLSISSHNRKCAIRRHFEIYVRCGFVHFACRAIWMNAWYLWPHLSDDQHISTAWLTLYSAPMCSWKRWGARQWKEAIIFRVIGIMKKKSAYGE